MNDYIYAMKKKVLLHIHFINIYNLCFHCSGKLQLLHSIPRDRLNLISCKIKIMLPVFLLSGIGSTLNQEIIDNMSNIKVLSVDKMLF